MVLNGLITPSSSAQLHSALIMQYDAKCIGSRDRRRRKHFNGKVEKQELKRAEFCFVFKCIYLEFEIADPIVFEGV